MLPNEKLVDVVPSPPLNGVEVERGFLSPKEKVLDIALGCELIAPDPNVIPCDAGTGFGGDCDDFCASAPNLKLVKMLLELPEFSVDDVTELAGADGMPKENVDVIAVGGLGSDSFGLAAASSCSRFFLRSSISFMNFS